MATPEQRKKIGQLFAVGFHGREINFEITDLIRNYGVGAIVLFKRNVLDADQLQKLCLGLQQIAKDAGHTQPLFIGIDQENGLVTRISPPVASQQPGPMTLGAAGSLDSAYQVANATAEMLRYFGINMNYAPVGDINSEPLNPVIGVRSPGDNPETVSKFALACARGMRDNKVVPCIKHFPGHGDTAVDSHYGLPVIDKSREDLEKLELIPFKNAVNEGIEMIMTAHISLPQLVGSSLPATLSPETIGILRNEWKYDGVIMTDCLEMDGIRATHGTVEGSLMAFQAGVDNVMICHTHEVQTAAIDRILRAVETGELAQERIDTSLRRLDDLKSRFTSWDVALHAEPSKTLAAINERGEKLARQVYADATTLVRSQPGLLPLSKSTKIVFVSPGPDVPIGGAVDSGTLPTRVPWITDTFGEAIQKNSPGLVDIRFTNSTLTTEQWQQVEKAEVVILATRNARESKYQKDLGLEIACRRQNLPLIAIATCAPYDFLEDAEIGTYIAIYEPTVEAFRSAVDILYGVAEPKGKLPVAQ
ncbi:Beta-hexosaminidase [Cladobotryum mycophilum]|uniref:Beta-hexosaminidase n=1 Tax=Cladobotryum mycophilum TaxID=491253 RepID=A0ABR0SHB2_9HYPO